MTIFEEAELLLRELKRCSLSYYNKSKSLISDSDFDKKKDDLISLYYKLVVEQVRDYNLEKEIDIFLKSPGAPVIPTEWPEIAHVEPMTSLNKVNSEEEFLKWVKEIGDSEYVIFDKMDGGSMDFQYEDGELIHGITRGDGKTGLDELQNVLKIQNVKRYIPGFTGNLNGEVFILRSDFEKLNEISDGDYKNPRNTATGLQKKFDGENVDLLSTFFYNIKGIPFKTEEEKMLKIESLGLKTCFWKKVTASEAIEVFKEYRDKIRANLEYDIDGLVIRANSIALQEKHGMVGGNPKAQIAWKFPPMEKETILLDIVWHTGNSTRVTPIAILQPTHMGGVTVRRATLHNVDKFMKFGFRKNCKVLLVRANDVIPQVLENRGDGEELFEIPTVCPECGGKTMIVEDEITGEKGKFLVCTNENCIGLATGNLERWISALDIDCVGPKTIQMIFEKGLVKEPADFYKLKEEQLVGLDRLGEKSAQKIIKNLNARKNITLPEFISGLNMPNFSYETAEALISAGYDLKMIQNASKEDLIKVKGIAEKTASQIKKGITSKETIINSLFDIGITIKEAEKLVLDSNKLNGVSFCFTGAINALKPDGKHFTRDDMHALVLKNGGNVQEGVNKTLTYLVMADPESTKTKAKKARELGTKILSEEEFFNMVK